MQSIAFVCPFCGLAAMATLTPGGGNVEHQAPPCEKFSALGPTDFLAEANNEIARQPGGRGIDWVMQERRAGEA